jgi:teichuronic acid biosynthesis protein TuaE
MAEPTPQNDILAPGSAATAALVVGGAVVTAGLMGFALRGPESSIHLAIALGLPLVMGVAVIVVLARRRLARLRVSRLLVAAVVALPALAVLGPALALPHLRTLFAFRVVLALVGFCGLLWLIVVRRRWRFEATTFAFLFGAWFCWLVITLAWAPDRGAGLRYLFLFGALGAIAIATASAGVSRRRLTYLLYTLAIVYGLSLLIGTAEWRLRIHLPTASPIYAHRSQPSAFFLNTNDFATYLALCWPFVLLLPTLRRRAWVVALTAAALLITFVVLLFTGSRTSLLALVVETVVVGAVIAMRGDRRTRLVVAAVAVVAVLGVGFLLAGRGGSLGSAFSVTQLAGQVKSGNGSGAVRSQLQIAGLHAAASRWFAGVGPGNAEIVVARQNPQFTVFNLHDWWLEVFVDGGLPGLLAFLTIYLLLLASMVRVARYARDAQLRYLGAATATALAGFIIAIVGPSTAVKFPPLAILFGLGIAVLIRARREDRESPAGPAAGGPAAAGGDRAASRPAGPGWYDPLS